ncbi:excinuclease ABC subunit UvrA [Mycoplasmopsis columbinasalis]|uniref:UvrABC system protein A n=1 Tax=Mycoplasmopsis columbinasalis TaxID=114880 RepID=A0A449B9T6_9BACT|nr:excinuclease ABC subunit UvrA [Mycoplasmopsis columbinasalis]VEU77943.1 ABC transporter ATP-binding protein [Mycoplasmopsis columbinasalis]
MSIRDEIIIKGARQHNLKNVSLTLPKNKLIVFSGLSGSGKSSLAFNTIYEEARRRYIDSLGTYAIQFLGGTSKPDVDSIEGLSPSISIEQETANNNPYSTVGTVTEIYEYLRLLYARIGKPFCPNHNIPIAAQTNKEILNSIFTLPDQSHVMILSPVVDNEKGTFAKLLEKLQRDNFTRVKIDGEIYKLGEDIVLEKNKKHTIDIVVDRIVLSQTNYNRIAAAVEMALKYSRGLVKIETLDGEIKLFSQQHSCKFKDFEMPKIEPKLFSFKSLDGRCSSCEGRGVHLKADFNALVPYPWLSIAQGAIKIFENSVGSEKIEWQEFNILCDFYNIDIWQTPIERMSEEELQIIKEGSPDELEFDIKSESGSIRRYNRRIEGILTKIERRYRETSSEQVRTWIKQFMSTFTCKDCKGTRLNAKALAVRVGDYNIAQLSEMTVDQALETIENLDLNEKERTIAALVISELKNRLSFLQNVGLNYLTLNRSAESLSGGESQRIKLATQIGSALTGVIYVLDEPSIGLHQRDNDKLIATLQKMVEIGNTLIVVEHDEDTIRAADFIVDIGPRAGSHGGEIVALGNLEDIKNNPNSLTGQYLSGVRKIEVPEVRRPGKGQSISVLGARENNLKNIDVHFPLGKFIAVTGVSGSGKSTLVNSILVNGLLKTLRAVTTNIKVGAFSSFKNTKAIDKVVQVTQAPIGQTSRSNPATYTGVFDDIRAIFANTTEAKVRGYQMSRFSFNIEGGRCKKCQGHGTLQIKMHFLPDVYITCDDCEGNRYNRETLEITYHGKNIADVLNLTVDEAIEFFQMRANIVKRLQTLQDVGLGYIKLGQSSTTLSGGEAQRVKLATHLQKKATGKTLFVLDEPTTGLHPYDVQNLLNVLNRIVDNGDTVLVIEHNLDVIKCADHIIDLGPEGGSHGGQVVATGTPEAVAQNPKSYTGIYLQKVLKQD